MRRRALTLLVVLVATLAFTFPAAAAQVVVVSPNNMHGWAFVDDNPPNGPGTGQMVNGPGNPPLGVGSANLKAPTAVDRQILIKSAYQGVRLADITQLDYWTWRTSPATTGFPYAISLQFNIDFDLTDINEGYQGRLVYEPYFTHTVQPSMWQHWFTQDNATLAGVGNWWFSRPPGNVLITGCPQARPCTWAQVLAKFPNAGIHRVYGAVLLKAGGGWIGFDGNTDALRIRANGETIIYDFEPNRPGCPSRGDGEFQGGQHGTFSFRARCERPDDDRVDSANRGDGRDFHSTQIASTVFDSEARTITITGIGASTGGLPVTFVFVAVETSPTTPGWVSFAFGDGYVSAGNLIRGVVTLD
jgi:hypothetical protein